MVISNLPNTFIKSNENSSKCIKSMITLDNFQCFEFVVHTCTYVYRDRFDLLGKT